MSSADGAIAASEALIEKYRNIKRGLLATLLQPKEGWKKVKLGECAQINRGGSPRPIDAFVTDSEDGINWIKIGDIAPNGKYVNTTSEKIILEGKQHSREVHKGDFILSNSMSFGRPYILNIDGCIHDGWLAIQDYEETFDTDFLYYMLSSDIVKKQYLIGYEDVYVAQSSNDMEHLLNHKTVKTELVDAQKGDFRASPVKGIEMRNVFEEPRKFTLRGKLKIVFAGGNGDRAVVAVPVPNGATDILYSLRISTDEGDRSTDGDFASDLDIRYHEIKFLGLPLYESKRGSGLIETLLNYKKPVREEDAYINLFVFNDGNQARKFALLNIVHA